MATQSLFGAGSRQGTELGHWRAVASNDDAFAVLDTAQHFSPVVPKDAHRHRVHMASVSPVRRWPDGPERKLAREYAGIEYAVLPVPR